MKAVLVGRHKLLSAQQEALRELGVEIIRQELQLPESQNELAKLVEKWKAEGAEAIVTGGLPPHLVAALSKFGMKILQLRMKAVSIAKSAEEAERLVSERPGWRVALPAPDGSSHRVMEFEGVYELRVVIEERRLWPP
jgi:uncharacterized coiled-coil protein SlyX